MKKTKNILLSTLIGGVLALQCTIAGAQGTSLADRGSAETIRPFHVDISNADLKDLRKRILATRWPDKETVADQSQGVQLAKLQELVRYWGTGYNWRKGEEKLNAFPQFKTMIDGLDIHFIHVKSHHPNALPLIITHGWPGSVFEQIKLIGPLTDPTKFGGRAEAAFDVVIPSLPGFGFSAQPAEAGWGLERIGQASATSPCGNTRNCSRGNCARHLNLCVNLTKGAASDGFPSIAAFNQRKGSFNQV